MKLPDITLFFQIVNFLLAYWMLRRFIFAPALEIIQSQEKKDKLLNDKVLDARTELENSIEHQKQRWGSIKYSLITMVPSVNLQKCLLKFKATAPIVTSKIEVSQEEKKSAQKILQDKLLDIQ